MNLIIQQWKIMFATRKVNSVSGQLSGWYTGIAYPRILESCWLFNGITPNPPIMHRSALIVLTTIISYISYENSYVTLSCGTYTAVPWNVPLVTCVFLVYTLA